MLYGASEKNITLTFCDNCYIIKTGDIFQFLRTNHFKSRMNLTKLVVFMVISATLVFAKPTSYLSRRKLKFFRQQFGLRTSLEIMEFAKEKSKSTEAYKSRRRVKNARKIRIQRFKNFHNHRS